MEGDASEWATEAEDRLTAHERGEISALPFEETWAMIKKVTAKGVLVPKEFFPGIDEVEVLRDNGAVVLKPRRQGDPIFEFGRNPLADDVTDASENLDHYLDHE